MSTKIQHIGLTHPTALAQIAQGQLLVNGGYSTLARNTMNGGLFDCDPSHGRRFAIELVGVNNTRDTLSWKMSPCSRSKPSTLTVKVADPEATGEVLVLLGINKASSGHYINRSYPTMPHIDLQKAATSNEETDWHIGIHSENRQGIADFLLRLSKSGSLGGVILDKIGEAMRNFDRNRKNGTALTKVRGVGIETSFGGILGPLDHGY